jgi:hypothetical protein
MYRHVCTITYLYIHVHTWYIHVYISMYRYEHVYTWYRRVYTTLPNPVHMIRIPDAKIQVQNLKWFRYWLGNGKCSRFRRGSSPVDPRVNLCQIKNEIICVQHGTPRHLYFRVKAIWSRLFCLSSKWPAGYPRAAGHGYPQVTSCQRLYDQIFKTCRIP